MTLDRSRKAKGSFAIYSYCMTVVVLLSMRKQGVLGVSFSGSGSIAAAPILSNWFFAYNAARPDVTLSYNGLAGPANAMNYMIGRTSATDFIIYNTSVPDSFSARTIPPNDMFQFPAVSAPYVMAYNLPYGSMMDPADSSSENRLVLDTNVTAAIFAFAVTNWRDPQILRLQTPTVAALLPNATIRLIVRQYGTDNIVFCNAVKRFNPSLWRWNISDSGWDAAFRNRVTQEVPGAFSAIMNTPNSLAYTNYPTIAGQDSFKFAAMVNLVGELMYTPDLGPAIDATPFDPATLKFSTNITSVSNRNISGAWPMGNIFFAVVRKLNTTRQLNCDDKRNLMQFWRWVFVTPSCSQRAKDSGYTPIPSATVEKILNAMDTQLVCYETGQTLLDFVANAQHTGAAYPTVLAITVLCAITTTALFVVYLVRDHGQLSVSAMSYYIVLFIGSLFNYAAFGLFWMVPTSNSVCLGRLWLGCLGFSMMLGAIFCRAYQVWAIRNLALSKSLSRGVRHCLIQAVGTGSVVAAQTLLLAVWTGVDPFSAVNVDVSDTDLSFNWICSSRHPKIWWSLEVVFVVALLAFGLYVVYQTWDLKHMVKESKWISVSIYNCVVALMLVGVLLSLTSPSDDGVFWTAGGSTLFLTFTIMLGMFLPRVLDIKSMTDSSSGSDQSQLDATRAPDSSGEKSPRDSAPGNKSPTLGGPRPTSKFGPSNASRLGGHHSSKSTCSTLGTGARVAVATAANTLMLPSSRDQPDSSPRTPGQVPQMEHDTEVASPSMSRPPAVYESADEESTQDASVYECPQPLPDPSAQLPAVVTAARGSRSDSGCARTEVSGVESGDQAV